MNGYIKVRIKNTLTGDVVDCYQHVVDGAVAGYVDGSGAAVPVPDPREEIVVDGALLENLP